MLFRSLIISLTIFAVIFAIPTSKRAKTDTEIIMAHMKRSAEPESTIRVVERKRTVPDQDVIDRDKRRSPQRRIHTSKNKDSGSK